MQELKMPNIVLTKENEILQWEDILYIADLLEISKIKNISLSGDEPTIHPNFVDFVLYLLERNFCITIFTNGILSQEKFEELEMISSRFNRKNISFVCNLNPPNNLPENEKERIDLFLSRFGGYVSSGFNIIEINFDFTFIINYIKEFSLKKYIKIGLAHPLSEGKNKYGDRKLLREIARQIVSFLPELEKSGISAGFDCGMPMCIFGDEELGKLFKISPKLLNFNCDPSINIGTDMTVWACLPFPNYKKKSVLEFDDFDDIYNYFSESFKSNTGNCKGIFEECNQCRYLFNHTCGGGCLAHIFNKVNFL